MAVHADESRVDPPRARRLVLGLPREATATAKVSAVWTVLRMMTAMAQP
jgi:hypothetical protein